MIKSQASNFFIQLAYRPLLGTQPLLELATANISKAGWFTSGFQECTACESRDHLYLPLHWGSNSVQRIFLFWKSTSIRRLVHYPIWNRLRNEKNKWKNKLLRKRFPFKLYISHPPYFSALFSSVSSYISSWIHTVS